MGAPPDSGQIRNWRPECKRHPGSSSNRPDEGSANCCKAGDSAAGKIEDGRESFAHGGGARLIDELVLGMNRAAEKAAPVAKDIFLKSMKQMTITDALQLIRGGDTAATDYFRKATEEDLIRAFRPPIETSMQEVGAITAYQNFTKRFQSMPFVKAESMDINGYVTTKAVDGLFLLVGEEEKKIRKNPAARVTPLLREVFGQR